MHATQKAICPTLHIPKLHGLLGDSPFSVCSGHRNSQKSRGLGAWHWFSTWSNLQKEQLQRKPSLSTQVENDQQNSTLLRHLQKSYHARWGRTWADAEVPPPLSLDKPALALTQQHNDYSDHMGMQIPTSLRSKPLSDTEREEEKTW